MIDLDILGAPAFLLDVSGERVTFAGVNRRLEALTGLLGADLAGRTHRDGLSDDVADAVAPHHLACIRSREPVSYETDVRLPRGRFIMRTALTPILGEQGGEVVRIVGVVSDVTGARSRELAMREALARAELALEAVEGGFWHYDVATGSFETSTRLGRFITGRDAVLDLSRYVEHVLADDVARADLSALVSGAVDQSVSEYRIRDDEAGVHWMRCRRRLLRDESGRPVRIVGIAFDITDQKRREERLSAEASTDPLTGLLNRRAFDAAAARLLAEAARSGERIAVLLLDVDHFKTVNDRHGHAVGDALLRRVADTLAAQSRSADLAARLGGDEFALLLNGVDAPAVSATAERIGAALSGVQRLPGCEIEVSVSIGGALAEEPEPTLAGLLARADAELYAVKDAGRASWRLAA